MADSAMHRAITLFCLLFALAGCDLPVVDSLQNLLEIRKSIIDVVDTDEVDISLSNERRLHVELINSELNDQPAEQRKEVADRLALLIYETYEKPDQLELVQISLVSVEQKYVIVSYSTTIDTFKYSKKALMGLSRPSL